MSAPLHVVGSAPRPTGATAHNVEAENAILAAVLEEPIVQLPRAIAAGLRSEHFWSEPNGRVWQALVEMGGMPGTVIHPVTVAQHLKDRGWPAPEGGWTAYLSRQARMLAPLDACLELVLDLADVRAVQAECERLAVEAKSPMRDRRAWALACSERIASRLSPRAVPVPDFQTIVGEVFAELDSPEAQRGPGEILGYPTGLDGVDRCVGGLVRAEIVLLTGVEKSGKSALGAQWCANVAERSGGKIGALIVQWEDPRQKTISRLIGARARVDLSRLRRGEWTTLDQSTFTQAAQGFGAIPLRVEDRCARNMRTVAATVRAVRDELASQGVILGAVMIDSLQALDGDDPRQNREQQLETAMKQLVALKMADDLRSISWLLLNHTGADGEMVNARLAPRRWCNTWLHLDVGGRDTEESNGSRRARLDVKLARDVEWGMSIPLWCWRRWNNRFEDGNGR